MSFEFRIHVHRFLLIMEFFFLHLFNFILSRDKKLLYVFGSKDGKLVES